MCGRFTLTTSSDVLAGEFKVQKTEASRLIARFNIAPSQPVALVLADARAGSQRWNRPDQHRRPFEQAVQLAGHPRLGDSISATQQLPQRKEN
jgi:putative SOS response-associated peptidase YedK